MHPAHLNLIKSQASSKPMDSAGLLVKVGALSELIQQTDLAAAPKALQAAKDELLDVIDRGARFRTQRSGAAAVTATRLLERLSEESAQDGGGSALTEQEQLTELSLFAEHLGLKAMNWEHSCTPAQLEWLRADLDDRVFGSDDPLGAWRAWLDDPPTPPASVGHAVPVPDDGEDLPDDDAELPPDDAYGAVVEDDDTV